MSYKKLKAGFKLHTNPSEKLEALSKYASDGALRGVYLGFPNIHKNYTMSIPGVTDWTGFPRSGKTQLLMEFLLNTSIFYGWRHLLYFPDVGNDTEILADLVHKVTFLSFDKRYKNHINESEISKALPWIMQHFIILTKEDLKAKLSPYEFWDLAVEIKLAEGLHTASIDSWKDMYHNTREFGRDDKYLEDVLSYRNAISDRHHLHLHTVIHPIKTEKEKDGSRKPPSSYDLKGGSEWFNNGRNMITVHRPNGSENEVDIIFNKIKPRSIGNEGKQTLNFDAVKFRYYFIDPLGKTRYADKTIPEIKMIDADTSEEDSDEIPF